jgi:hypothetical protein
MDLGPSLPCPVPVVPMCARVPRYSSCDSKSDVGVVPLDFITSIIIVRARE